MSSESSPTSRTDAEGDAPWIGEPPRFRCYEHVQVAVSRPEIEPLNALDGVVLGRTESPQVRTYGVLPFKLQEVWMLEETDLQSTGVQVQRADFYSGASLRVRVDEHGRGHLVPPGEGPISE